MFSIPAGATRGWDVLCDGEAFTAERPSPSYRPRDALNELQASLGQESTFGLRAHPLESAGWKSTSSLPGPDVAEPEPVWYPDPTGRHTLRNWDGLRWTEHVHDAGASTDSDYPDRR